MDKVKVIDLLYEVLPYVQKGEQLERDERKLGVLIPLISGLRSNPHRNKFMKGNQS